MAASRLLQSLRLLGRIILLKPARPRQVTHCIMSQEIQLYAVEKPEIRFPNHTPVFPPPSLHTSDRSLEWGTIQSRGQIIVYVITIENPPGASVKVKVKTDVGVLEGENPDGTLGQGVKLEFYLEGIEENSAEGCGFQRYFHITWAAVKEKPDEHALIGLGERITNGNFRFLRVEIDQMAPTT